MTRRANHDLVDIACTLLADREKSYFIDTGDKKVFVPKSLCEIDVDSLGHGTVTMPEWLAMEKELI